MSESENSGLPKDRERRIELLAKMLKSNDPWVVADLVVALKVEDGLKLHEIVAKVEELGARDYKVPYFSQVAHTATAFPPEKRFPNLNYTSHFKAAVAIKQINNSLARRNKPKIDYFESLREYLATETALPTSRRIMAAFRRRMEDVAAPLPKSKKKLNECHHADCVDFAKNFPDQSIPLVWLDPPYGDFKRTKTGELDQSTSAFYTAHDNEKAEDAVRVTCDAIVAFATKVLPNGLMLLWQADQMMRPEIAKAIFDAGFECRATLVWTKPGRSKLGNYDSPFEQTKEFCYVLRRKGDQYRVLNTLTAVPDIISIDLVRAGVDDLPHHLFEKPVELCKLLLNATTLPDELVVDAFSCTGSMCKAAIELGRSWVYIESNDFVFDKFAGFVQKKRDEAPKAE